jgi:hypothetical protein
VLLMTYRHQRDYEHLQHCFSAMRHRVEVQTRLRGRWSTIRQRRINTLHGVISTLRDHALDDFSHASVHLRAVRWWRNRSLINGLIRLKDVWKCMKHRQAILRAAYMTSSSLRIMGTLALRRFRQNTTTLRLLRLKSKVRVDAGCLYHKAILFERSFVRWRLQLTSNQIFHRQLLRASNMHKTVQKKKYICHLYEWSVRLRELRMLWISHQQHLDDHRHFSQLSKGFRTWKSYMTRKSTQYRIYLLGKYHFDRVLMRIGQNGLASYGIIFSRSRRSRIIADFHRHLQVSREFIIHLRSKYTIWQRYNLHKLRSVSFWKVYRLRLGLKRFTVYAYVARRRRDLARQAWAAFHEDTLKYACSTVIRAGANRIMHDKEARRGWLASKYGRHWLSIVQKKFGANNVKATQATTEAVMASVKERIVYIEDVAVKYGRGTLPMQKPLHGTTIVPLECDETIISPVSAKDITSWSQSRSQAPVETISGGGAPTNSHSEYSFAAKLPAPRPLRCKWGQTTSTLGLVSGSELAAARLELAKEICDFVTSVRHEVLKEV